MNNKAQSRLEELSKLLISLNYRVETMSTDATIVIKSEDINFIQITYSEEGERSGYSLYDIDLVVKLETQDFIYILSERSEDELEVDFDHVKSIIQSVNDKTYQILHESFLIFWKRTYMKVTLGREELYLLRTKG